MKSFVLTDCVLIIVSGRHDRDEKILGLCFECRHLNFEVTYLFMQ